MKFSFLPLLVLFVISPLGAYAATCPSPAGDLKAVFDSLEKHDSDAAVAALYHSSVPATAETRNEACETLQQVALRTNQPAMLTVLATLKIDAKDLNAAPYPLYRSVFDYALEYSSLTQIRTYLERGATIPAFDRMPATLVNALLHYGNADALSALTRDGSYTVKEIATAFVDYRQKAMSDSARYRTLLRPGAFALLEILRTEIRAADVYGTDVTLAFALAGLEAGRPAADVAKDYAFRLSMSPGATSEAAADFRGEMQKSQPDLAKLRAYIETTDLDWIAAGGGASGFADTALSWGSPELVAFFIAQPKSHDLMVGKGSLALNAAIGREKLPVVETLLAGGADLNAPDSRGMTPLMTAARSRSDSILKVLIAKGADAKGEAGGKALVIAAGNGSTANVKALLAAGADPVYRDAEGNSALSYAGSAPAEMVTALLGAGAGKCAGCLAGALVRASGNGNRAVVLALLKAGADANAADADGRTPLYHASSALDHELVRALLAAHANPNGIVFRNYGEEATSCLSLAVEHEDAELVSLLIAGGADAKESVLREGKRVSPRHVALAVEAENPALVKLLIAAKANLDEQDSRGRTALILAVKNAEEEHHYGNVEKVRTNTEIARMLVEAGAKKNLRDSEGKTAFRYATFKVWGPSIFILK